MATINIQIFKTLKLYMQLMGILKLQLPNRCKYIPITWIQRTFILSCVTISAISSFYHCIFKIKETYELFETLYFALGFSLFVILYTIFLWKQHKFIQFFDAIEEKVQNRKFINIIDCLVIQ